ELDLVEIAKRRSGSGDLDAPFFDERDRIEHAQLARAVGHDQVRAVVGQPPALTRITELLLRLEGSAVVHERDVRLPRQLEQIVFPDGDALTEMRRRQVSLLQNFSGLDFNLPNRRL